MSLRFWLWKIKTKWRTTKYLLYDNKRGMPPIVGVYLLFALVGVFLYSLLPWTIVVLASITAAYFIIRFVIRTAKNIVFSVKATQQTGRVRKHQAVHVIKGQPRLQTPSSALYVRPLGKHPSAAAETQPIKVKK